MEEEQVREELITFETAQLAKQKGFHCDLKGMGWIGMCYDKKGKLCDDFYDEHGKEMGAYFKYLAPTQSLLQKWLREQHEIYVLINYVGNKQFNYEVNAFQDSIIGEGFKGTYEEAL